MAGSSNPKIKILYRHFPQYGKAFLIAQLNPDNQSDEEDLRTRYADILDTNRPVSEEILLRHSRRAYPAIMALDENIWINIQKSEVANLALSPEEEKILESIRGTANNTRRYPLFINGRPRFITFPLLRGCSMSDTAIGFWSWPRYSEI